MSPRHWAHYHKAEALMPWATQTNAKRYDNDFIATRPPFIDRAEGCRMWDMDGREYIDYRAALGPIVLGYRYPDVEEAVKRQLEKGTLFSMASPVEAEAAEAILNTLGWADKIRFMKTGADVCACCLRLARTYTGRDHLATSGYHGYQDWFALSSGWPNPGVPVALNDYIHKLTYGDLDSVERVFKSHGDQLAAVIVSPVEWSQNPRQDYLKLLRERCDQFGVVLIFDEVLTGFRLAKGGAPEYFGVQPDLSAYAKGIANGYPLSAYAGKAEVMDALNRSIITTTYAGETLSLAAAVAVMEVFEREPVHAHLFRLGKRLRGGLDAAFKEFGFPAQTIGVDVAVDIAFAGSEADRARKRHDLFEKLYAKGIFANNEWFITYAHRETDIDETIAKVRESLKELSSNG